MVELLLDVVLTAVLEIVFRLLFVGPGQLLLVLFKQRRFSEDPGGMAVCLSIGFWLILGSGIWLLVAFE
jgi:hypothetical protein